MPRIKIDREALSEFNRALRAFNSEFHDRWSSVDGKWKVLDDSWEGPTKEAFLDKQGWDRVRQQMRAYLDQADDYLKRLEEMDRKLEEIENQF